MVTTVTNHIINNLVRLQKHSSGYKTHYQIVTLFIIILIKNYPPIFLIYYNSKKKDLHYSIKII